MDSTDSLQSDEEEESTTPVSFISWITSRPGTNWLCEVEPAWIEDRFNLYGLDAVFPHFRQCIEILLGGGPQDGIYVLGDLVSEAIDLYGMIHARYILTPKGTPAMAEKLAGGVFGACPRFQCKRQSVLPIGLSENLRENHTALFCPRCQEIYEMSAPDRAFMTTMIQRSRSLQRGATSSGGSDASSSSGDPGPRSSISRGSWKCLPGLDGAYFGPSFPHMLLLQFPQFLGAIQAEESYVPRIFGFRVHSQRGPAPRLSGDSRGLYATAVDPPPAAASVAQVSRTTGSKARGGVSEDSSAPGTRASPSKRATRHSASAAVVSQGGSGLPFAGGTEAAKLEGNNAQAFALLPIASASLSSVPAGAPATLAPFVFPIEGMPGGVPVYGKPRFDGSTYRIATARDPLSSAAGVSSSHGGIVVDQAGVSYLVMRPNRIPMTSRALPGAPKDDFSDNEDDTTATAVATPADSSGTHKRKRRM